MSDTKRKEKAENVRKALDESINIDRAERTFFQDSDSISNAATEAQPSEIQLMPSDVDAVDQHAQTVIDAVVTLEMAGLHPFAEQDVMEANTKIQYLGSIERLVASLRSVESSVDLTTKLGDMADSIVQMPKAKFDLYPKLFRIKYHCYQSHE